MTDIYLHFGCAHYLLVGSARALLLFTDAVRRPTADAVARAARIEVRIVAAPAGVRHQAPITVSK